MTAIGRFAAVTVDCRDPHRLAAFWATLLDGPVSEPLPGWQRVSPPGGAPVITFQPVTEPKAGKTRIHLDVTVTAEIAVAVDVIAGLGGRWTGERHDYPEGSVLVMADPEDNEFCIVRYHGLS